MKKPLRLTFVATLFFVVGCSFATDSHLRNACGPWLSTFYGKPLKERITTFESYNLENQYQIFICGNQVVHPPAIYLAEPFAKQGVIVVPLLKLKLENADDDLTVRDIVLVFAEMHRQHSYNVSEDTGLVKLMIEKVNGMHDSEWRAIAQRNVDRILGRSR